MVPDGGQEPAAAGGTDPVATRRPVDRRELLRGGLALGLGGALGERAFVDRWLGGAPAVLPSRGGGLEARNIIFFALDGFSWEDLAAGQSFARRRLGRPLVMSRLFAGAGSGSCETYSLGSVVTDSSAASCAWATGRKIVNGMVNEYPDGTRLTPILELARAQGRATGLVTTARITHATPAGWLAHVPDRNMEDEIALQYLAFAPDVLLGGGATHFDPARRRDGRDVAAEFERAGYAVVRTSEALRASNTDKLLGIFSNSHIAYEIDRQHQGVAAPSLADITRAGLRVLDGAANGFVVQVEAGRIDHANHQNDAATSIWDVVAADEALAEILAFMDGRDDTLLLLASDHATGGGAVYGVGSFYRRASDAFERIDRHRGSFEHMRATLGARPDAAALADAIAAYTGVRLTPDQAERAAESFVNPASASPHRTAFNDQPYNTVGFVVGGGGAGRALNDRVNFNFATGQHTAGAVPVAVYGAGAEARAFGLIDNTELYGWMCDALGVRHENPQTSSLDSSSLSNAIRNQYVKAAGSVSSA
jgi:alkaline phosphatase